MIPRALLCHKHLIKSSAYSIRYTRQFFEDLNIDREAIRKNQLAEAQRLKKQHFRNLKYNDKNPNNYIKNLKIDHQALNYFPQRRKKQEVSECCILTPEPPKAPVRFFATRRNILTTLKKATLTLKPIRKMYLTDAMAFLQHSQKKVGKQVLITLNNLIRHGVEKGYDLTRLFIHGIIVGKTMRHKGIRYHAKGKGGIQQRDICQVKVIVQQKDQTQFYTQVGAGEAPGNYGSLIRYRLKQIKAGYQKVSACVGITTAKGRQQQKQLVRRKIFMTMNENKKNGIFVPKKVVEKQIKQQQGQKAKILIQSLKEKEHLTSIKVREQVFKKNMGVE